MNLGAVLWNLINCIYFSTYFYLIQYQKNYKCYVITIFLKYKILKSRFLDFGRIWIVNWCKIFKKSIIDWNNPKINPLFHQKLICIIIMTNVLHGFHPNWFYEFNYCWIPNIVSNYEINILYFERDVPQYNSKIQLKNHTF